jgi:hypothetical protein
LQEEDLAPLFRQPLEDAQKGEDVPEVEDEETNKDPEVYIPRTTKRPRAATTGVEGSAKKAKPSQGRTQHRYDANSMSANT